MEKLSENFNRYEFACQGVSCCDNSAPISPSLVASLQEFRNLVGRPVKITSGFRCNKHNAEVGGAKKSQHRLGFAVDVSLIPGFTIDEMADKAEQVYGFHSGGIIKYDKWLHLDVRGEKYRGDKRT